MKKIAAFLLVFAGFTSTVIIQSCQSTKTVTTAKMLKFNFEKDKGYDYEMIMNMDQEENGQTRKMDVSTYYSMKVTGDDGDTKIITTTFDRFKLKMDMERMNLEVDTDKPLPESGNKDPEKDPVKMINRFLGAIKGKQFSMKVNAEGKVTEIAGFKAMAQSIVNSMGLEGEQYAAIRKKMTEEFEKQFNDEGVKSEFEKVLYIFPNKEVKVGDSWKKTSQGIGPTAGTYNTTYTVKEIEGDMVTLDENSTITTPGLKNEDAKMEMDGTVKGTIVVDSRSGLVVNADQKMSIKTKSNGTSGAVTMVSKVKGKAN